MLNYKIVYKKLNLSILKVKLLTHLTLIDIN